MSEQKVLLLHKSLFIKELSRCNAYADFNNLNFRRRRVSLDYYNLDLQPIQFNELFIIYLTHLGGPRKYIINYKMYNTYVDDKKISLKNVLIPNEIYI